MKGLTFDPGPHTYTLDGKMIPGITQMLRAAGLLGEVASLPPQAAAAGSARHAWIEADLHGRLGPKTPIPDAVRPYVLAARRAIRETGAQILQVEALALGPGGVYATKIDALARIRAETWILDWKTGGAYSFYPVQLALASWCYRAATRRACVYLTRRGTYRMEEHADPLDYAQARWVLSQWKLIHAAPAPAPAGGKPTEAKP